MDRALLYGLLALGMLLLSLSPYRSTMKPAKALRHLRNDEPRKRSVLQWLLPIQIGLALAITLDLVLLLEFGGGEGSVLFALHLLTLPLLVLPMATFGALPAYVVVRHRRDQRDAKEARAGRR